MTEMVLKPCPFCGGKPEITMSEIPVERAVRIRCASGCCERIGRDDRPWAHNSEMIATERAVAAWNTRAPPSSPVGEGVRETGWQPIETAPKDGTQVLAWCVHPFRRYGGEGYEGPVIAHWTDHNDGGWTWYGLTGQFTHWMPLPQPPALLFAGEAKE